MWIVIFFGQTLVSCLHDIDDILTTFFPNIFGNIFDQAFGQVFDQIFVQGFLTRKYSVQFYQDEEKHKQK